MARPTLGPIDLLAATRAWLDALDSPALTDFVAGHDWVMAERTLVPNSLPCARHLPGIVADAPAAEAPLLTVLGACLPRLRWGQTYGAGDFGAAFLDEYGWIELFGTRGHFASETIAGGFLLLGPRIHYPDHHHVAEEIYVPLTGGALWRMGDADFRPRAAGDIIVHGSDVSHAMKTSGQPLLALYLWRGGDLAAKSTVTGIA